MLKFGLSLCQFLQLFHFFLKIFSFVHHLNDHILFFKPNEKLEFKNILTNRITNKIISQENNKQITMIYKNYDNTINKQTSEFDYQNPTSEN